MVRKRVILAAGMVVAALLTVNAIWFRPWSIRVFFDRITVRKSLDSPQMLSSTRILAPYGLHWYDARLDDLSDAKREADFKQARLDLDTLRRYDRAGLDAADQLSYDTLRWTLEHELAGERFRFHTAPINQLDGQQMAIINFLTINHPISTLDDAQRYVERLHAVPLQLKQLDDAVQERARRGIVAPNFALRKSAAGMRVLVATLPEQNPLYLDLQHKMQAAKLAASQQTALLGEARRVLVDMIYPAYRQLINRTERLAQSHPRNDGVWALPDGDAYYAWLLAGNTTTQLSPEQVHQLGLDEVGRIEDEMHDILQKLDEPHDNLGATMRRLGNDPRFLFPDDEHGRQQILDGYKAILQEAQAALPKAFSHIPATKLDVRRAPAISEQTATGAYYEPGALDGSRPGVFYTALYDVRAAPRWSMRTLAFHEGVPGHHLQATIAQEQTQLPLFRRFAWYDAYGEGWALYAERLAWEIGLQPDPYDQLGRLRDELFRAARLVVDTGIHAKRWSREQAIAYMERTLGMPYNDVAVEVERYFIWPGQACAYKIGMIKILALREQAKTRLGPRFDLRRFHDLILRNGALPLDLLDQEVQAWIAAGGKE